MTLSQNSSRNGFALRQTSATHSLLDADLALGGVAKLRTFAKTRPDALWATGDIGFHLCAGATGRGVRPFGRVGDFYQPDDVEKLRAGPPVTRWASVGDEVDPPPREPHPRSEARRQEIIAVSDAWAAERRAVADQVGLTKPEEEDDRLYAAVWEARDAIRGMAPVTLAGRRAKASWATGLDDPEEENAALAEQVAAFGGVMS